MLRKFALPVLFVMMIVPLTWMLIGAEESATALEVETALASVVWLEIEALEITDNADSETMLTLHYVTRETDMLTLRAETLEIFRTLGALDMEMPAAEIAISPRIPMGAHGSEGLELAVATAEDIKALASGEMTRTDFLQALSIRPLEHQQREEQDPA